MTALLKFQLSLLREYHLIHLLQEYTVLLADDEFRLIENQN